MNRMMLLKNVPKVIHLACNCDIYSVGASQLLDLSVFCFACLDARDTSPNTNQDCTNTEKPIFKGS